MKRLLFLFSFTFLPAFVACSWKTTTYPLHLFPLIDESFVGDANQIKGVIAALREQYAGPVVEHGTLADLPTLSRAVIIAGSARMQELAALPLTPGIYRVLCMHQAPANLVDLGGKLDLLALPTHATTSEITAWADEHGTRLVQTVGVAHNTSVSTVEQAYQDHRAALPLPPPYLAVMLGGDAPDTNNVMRYYTEHEAQALAKAATTLARGQKANLVVLNGPRTGKHDPKTGMVRAQAHRDGAVDPATAAFIHAAAQEGFTAGSNLLLLDFQFGKPSLFNAVLGALRATQGKIIINGDSISMISECTTVLNPDQVILASNAAMSEIHHAYLKQEHACGRASLLSDTGGLILPDSTATPPPPAAQAIAHTLLNQLNKK